MIEALAMGLPTICTDCPCGGARMVIKDGENGLLVPVGDRVALVETIIKIASDNNLAEKLSLEAIKIRELLAVETIVKKWQVLIK
jgi:glycosyltransferase involved in cell wall biosynthesis